MINTKLLLSSSSKRDFFNVPNVTIASDTLNRALISRGRLSVVELLCERAVLIVSELIMFYGLDPIVQSFPLLSIHYTRTPFIV
jgi:hypothetical protein